MLQQENSRIIVECNNRKRMFLEDKNLCDFQKGGVVIYNISLNFAS